MKRLILVWCLLITGCKVDNRDNKSCKNEAYAYPSAMQDGGMCQDLGAGVYYCMSQKKVCK